MADATSGEPARARRIRDRDRMRARGTAFQKFRCTGPSGLPGDGRAWRDLAHRLRFGLGTWDDVTAFRRMRGVTTADNLAACSCHMCGNPRRFWGAVTLQEARAAAAAAEQFADGALGVPVRKPRTC